MKLNLVLNLGFQMRDPEYQNRRGNSFKVSYPDFPAVNQPARSVTIYQEMGKHDIVEIFYPRFSTALFKAIKTGVPVQITWNNDKVKETFYGYTTDVSYPTLQKIDRGVKILCVGSSYPLKERDSKIWVNKTATEVAQDIAKKHKLKPFITPHATRFNQISLAGHSYWEKLNELAAKIGYGVQVYGTELHFHPIDEMINQFMTSIPVMMFKDPMMHPMSSFNAPTLDVFEPRLGDYIESTEYLRTTNTVSGVDPLTAAPYTQKISSNKVGKSVRKTTKDPLFNSVETQIVVASNAMAKSLAEGRAQLGRLSIPAKGLGQGDPRIAPWRTIEVRGTGDVSDGFWIVKKVEHFIHTDGRYQVEFECMTDGTGANKPTATRPSNAGSVPVRNVISDLKTPNKTKPTSSKLSGATAMVSQSNAGYKVTPRRWSGK